MARNLGLEGSNDRLLRAVGTRANGPDTRWQGHLRSDHVATHEIWASQARRLPESVAGSP
jgi:hypothetical protein